MPSLFCVHSADCQPAFLGEGEDVPREDCVERRFKSSA